MPTVFVYQGKREDVGLGKVVCSGVILREGKMLLGTEIVRVSVWIVVPLIARTVMVFAW